MKNIFYLPIIFIVGLYGCSDRVKNNDIVKPVKSDIYLYSSDKCEKLLIRNFFNDSIFSDRIYENYGKLISTDTFKRINSTWYYIDKGAFCEFFSETSFEKHKIKRKHYDCSGEDDNGYNVDVETYIPVRVDTVDAEKVYVYEKVYTGSNDTTLSNCYSCHVYFDPSIGFVYVEDESCGNFKVKKINAIPKEWDLKK